jgi:hypothetical protein
LISRFIGKSFAVFNKIVPCNDKLTIITGASSQFFDSLYNNLLLSILKYEPDSPIIVWDLGLDKNQIHQLEIFPNVRISKFDFSKFPNYFSLQFRTFAFKSVCIFETISDQVSTDFVFWLDAGCKLTGRLNAIRRLLKIYGFYSPYSRTTVDDLTVPLVIKHFALEERAKERMINAAVIGVNRNNFEAFQIIREWYDLTFNKDLLAPDGSDNSNHRQDQSLLACVYYSRKSRIPLLCQRYYKFKVHCNKQY